MKYSIKTNILTIFLLLIGVVFISLLTTQYHFNSKLAIASTDKSFEAITLNVTDYIDNHNQRINNTLKANYNNTHLNEKIDFDYKHPALYHLVQVLTINQGMSSIYFAQKNSSFYKLTNIQSSPALDNINVPKRAKWVITISIYNQTQYTFLDENLGLIKTIHKKVLYNPLTRPWYIRAISSKQPIRTEVYMFHELDVMGITYAQELQKKGTVLAIDYTVTKLNQILSIQQLNQSSEVFVFDTNGRVIASSHNYPVTLYNNTQEKIDDALFKAFKSNKDSKTIKYTQNNIHNLSVYTSLDYQGLYLGIKLDSDILLAPYNKNMQYLFIISLLILILTIPLILFSTNLIIYPIQKLIVENKKIQHRDFQNVTAIKTHIIEFQELSTSLLNMSRSINEYQASQRALLDSIVKLIAEAVDAKSPYTGGHCNRVPEIAQLLVNEANKSNDGVFKEFTLESEDDLREFKIGSWLHDCGKVTTPEYVVDKSTKLETINDRIHEIRTRFEVLWRDAQITYLEAKLNGGDSSTALNTLNATQEKLIEDYEFIANSNIGGEFMSSDKQDRIREIAKTEWTRHFDDSLGLGEVEILRYDKDNAQSLPAQEKLLSDKKQHLIKRENFDYEAYEKNGFKEEVPEYLYNYGEVYNLCIAKGTLSPEERYKINEHVILTIKMLEKIPFPSQMTKIPEYAGTHHETLTGSGYPRKLSASDLSIPARIMALADVFEALTASDRPYKKAKTLSESVKILSFMVKDKHLDEDVFKLFLQSDLHNVYAKRYLKPEQIDEVDIEQYL